MQSLIELSTSRADDPLDLNRFVQAQEHECTRALAEIRLARKRTHWMWYIFPQIDGLGFSETARRYSIRDLDEARAYLEHPVLGPRLVECAEAVFAVHNRSATQIFGTPDDLKLRSRVTLFAEVTPSDSVFHRLIEVYFGGAPYRRTLTLLGQSAERA